MSASLDVRAPEAGPTASRLNQPDSFGAAAVIYIRNNHGRRGGGKAQAMARPEPPPAPVTTTTSPAISKGAIQRLRSDSGKND